MFVMTKNANTKEVFISDGLDLIYEQKVGEDTVWFFRYDPSIVGKYSNDTYQITKKMFF